MACTPRLTMASKSTDSSKPWLSWSCTIAIVPTPLGLLERRPGVLRDPTRLEPEQRGHRLEVVLDAVVDLADRRLLRHELALAPTQLSDVA